MAKEGYFSEENAKRVAAVTRLVESEVRIDGQNFRRRDGNPLRPWAILTGSLATDLTASGACSAGFNVDTDPFCHGAPRSESFLPTYITVYRYRRWLPGLTSLSAGTIYAAGTNGSAIWVANKLGYAFVPDCTNVSDEDPSDTSDTSDGSGGGFEAAYYCITNGGTTCCMFLTTEADLPPGYTVSTGPYAASNCDMVCAACE